MRTKSLRMAIDYCARNGMNMSVAVEKEGWIYLPDKAEKFPTSMQHRKTRDFEHISREFRPCASGKAKYYPVDEAVGRTVKERI